MTDRWLTFDCYGTLIDWNGGIGATLARLWPDADIERLLARYHAVEPLIEEGRDLPYREVLARALRAVSAIEGLALPVEEADALSESLPSWLPFPEVPESMAELRRRGWRLGILSNIDPDLLQSSLRRLTIPIDVTVTARDAGSYKPTPSHWKVFYERSGADPQRHIHVAASLFHDIEPAQRLGIPAVWINRLDEVSDLSRAAELTGLEHLPATVERLLPPSSSEV